MTTLTTRKGHDDSRRLRAELRRRRRFVESLCSQLHAELGALKHAPGDELADRIALLQTNLAAVADVERLQGGASELAQEVFDLHTIARTAVARHAFAADDHRARLRCFVHKDAPRRVVGDPSRLRQLLGDLVANALPHSGGGGLFVFVAPEPAVRGRASVRFTICDRESGPPDALRPPTSVREKALWITPFYESVRELVRRMGGDVGFQASDEGAAVWFTVSLATSLPQLRPTRAELATQAPVLLVTESRRRAAAVAAALQRCGLLVQVEPNEQLMPIRMQETSYGVVLMDRDRGPDVATFAARTPGSDQVRMVPIVGVPRRADAPGEIDEAALLELVQRRIGPRPHGGR